jgi:hypothetical protein
MFSVPRISSSPAPAITGPIIRRPDTGCSATLGAGLVPSQITHGKKCKCIPVNDEKDYIKLAETARVALVEGILECEKPTVAFAMLLLGGEVVY